MRMASVSVSVAVMFLRAWRCSIGIVLIVLRGAGARGRRNVVHVQKRVQSGGVNMGLQCFRCPLEEGTTLGESSDQLCADHIAAARLGGLFNSGDGSEGRGQSVAS